MFKAIPAGIFNAITVSKRFREVWAAIDGLKEAQAQPATKKAAPKKAPAKTKTVDSAETVVIEE